MTNSNDSETLDNWGEEEDKSQFLTVQPPKNDVNPYDIFKLANWILMVTTGIYISFAMIRIFYHPADGNNEGIKEVWEYSKVVLNSVVSLVLGLYFGSNHEARKGRS